MNLLVTPINTSVLRLSWNSTSALRWPNYQIDSFNVSVTNINSSQRLFEASTEFHNSTEISRLNLIDADVLQPCTTFNFSISSISATYGESDPSFIIGGFPEGLHNTVSTVIFMHNMILYYNSIKSLFQKPGKGLMYQCVCQ